MSILVKNLSYIYMKGTPFEKRALDNVNLKIEHGEIVGIIGHTGSGKSTLIQHFNGLLKPSSGSVSINGAEISSKGAKELRRQVGLVFQYPEHQLFEETVYRDIAFGLRKKGVSEQEVDKKVRESLSLVGLNEEILEKSPFQLSGGQKRRVAIAGILVLEPSILVLDEPAAGLDPGGRDEILCMIKKLHNTKGMTVVFVSHSMEDIAEYVDRVIAMSQGSIEMDGPIAVVFNNVELLEKISLSAPQITYFMKRMKELLPDINDNIFTVDQAKEELKRVFLHGNGIGKEKTDFKGET
jgi:energy-coupling factor transport system ATP-binding protein